MTDAVANEFERPIKVDEIERSGTRYEIEASETERAALAERFQILAIDHLSGTIVAKPVKGDEVELTGQVKARVVQACVISNEPVPQEIDEPFEIRFSPHAEEIEFPDADSDVEFDPALLDLPEPLIGGMIDIGETLAQEAALCLDPYPRAENAELTHDSVISEEEVGRQNNPFQGLAALKDKLTDRS